MITIPCACTKNRARGDGSKPPPAGTYRVMVDGRKVYETTNKASADGVAAKFDSKRTDVRVLAPGEAG